MIKESISKVSRNESLSFQEAETVFSQIAQGVVSEEEISSFLVALARKGETPEEITGAASAMRKVLSKIDVVSDVIVDTCGTGGDGKKTFNISTVSAFVVAGVGFTVAKHGNRSVSSRCGSADLLEALGVNIGASVETVQRCINSVGIGFLFAPNFHPAMRHVQPVRRRLKMRTIFNILGPLINPAFPTHQLIGVYDQGLVPVVAAALKELGLEGAMVVWGEGGFDEVTTTAKTFVCALKDGGLREYVLEPEKLGISKVLVRELEGGDTETNKQIALNVLKGLEGPHRDVVVLNAGCAIHLAGRALTIQEGIKMARESIDSGHAIKKLHQLIESTSL